MYILSTDEKGGESLRDLGATVILGRFQKSSPTFNTRDNHYV